MILTEHQHTRFLYELDDRQAVRIFEQAVRERVVINLVPRTCESRNLCGPIVSATPESVWIELDDESISPDGPLQSVCCDGEVSVTDSLYIFATNVLSMTQENGRCRLEIVRPDELSVVQRRRFGRKGFQETTSVELIAASDAAAGGTCGASLLNLSANGMACRADRAHADLFAVGQSLNLEFRISPDPEPYVLGAVLRTKTPAGSEGCVVMGLQFEPSAHSNTIGRLRACLAGAPTS